MKKKSKAKKKSATSRKRSIPKQEVTSKTCPSCNKTAKSKNIEDVFGWRNMGDMIRPQTYCRKCRTKHGIKMRELKSRKKGLRGIDLRTVEGHSQLLGKRLKISTKKSKSKSKASKTKHTKKASKHTSKKLSKRSKQKRKSLHAKSGVLAKKLASISN